MTKKRSKRGIVLLACGCVLLLGAVGWLGYNVWEDRHAGQQASALLEKVSQQIQNGNVAENADTVTVEENTFYGVVSVEAIGVELPVLHEWSYPNLKQAPCRYSGSIASNDCIIAAHNYDSHFGDLGRLRIGDIVTFTDVHGTVHRYSVCEVVSLDGYNVSDMQAGDWAFTLFTCTKSGKQRVTVRCERQ